MFMTDPYRRGIQQALLQYARPPLLSPLGQRPRPNPTGILKWPFGLHRGPKPQCAKTLRFDLSRSWNPTSLDLHNDGRSSALAAATGDNSSAKQASEYASNVVKKERVSSMSGSALSESSTSSRRPSSDPVDALNSDLSSSAVVGNDTSTSFSTTTSGTSAVREKIQGSHSITEDVRRYFGRWGVKGDATASASSQSWSFTGSRSSRTERWQGLPHQFSRRSALLTLLAALLLLLLASTSAQVYGTMSDEDKSRTMQVTLQDEASGVASLEGGSGQMPSYWRRYPSDPHSENHYGSEDRDEFPNKDFEWRNGHNRIEKPGGLAKEDAEEAEAYLTSTDLTSSVGDVWHENTNTLTRIGTDELEEPTTEYGNVEEILNNSPRGGNTSAAENKQGPSRCGAFAFNYCLIPRREFFYKRSVNACVEVTNDNVGVCTRGRNRFPSKKSCHEECVEKKRRGQQCLVGAVFQQCNSRDVRGKWWHYDGRSCLLWNFTSGLCPSHESDVFPSHRRCWSQCVSRPRKRLCHAAAPDVCYSDRLRFPYFALAEPAVRCLKVSTANYLGHRCLTGPNRFDTLQACEKACTSNRLHI